MNILNYSIIFIIINYLLLIIVSKVTTGSAVGLTNGTYTGLNISNINKFSNKIVRQYGLIISIMLLYLTLILWYSLSLNNELLLMNNVKETIYNIGSNNIILGFDNISLYYCLLIGIIILVSILSGWYMKSKESNMYILLPRAPPLKRGCLGATS